MNNTKLLPLAMSIKTANRSLFCSFLKPKSAAYWPSQNKLIYFYKNRLFILRKAVRNLKSQQKADI